MRKGDGENLEGTENKKHFPNMLSLKVGGFSKILVLHWVQITILLRKNVKTAY